MITPKNITVVNTEIAPQRKNSLSCDQIAWLLDIAERYLPQDGKPRISREREMKKYAMLYEIMEITDSSFADDSARYNGTPKEAKGDK